MRDFSSILFVFFFQAEDGIRDVAVTGVQTCALPIYYPDAYISMGLGTENIARKFGIAREQADEFSLASHKKALAAIAAGSFKDETFPVDVKITSLPSGNGASSKPKSAPQPVTQTLTFSVDEEIGRASCRERV